MKKLQLLPVGNPDPRLLEWLRQSLADKFRVRAEILADTLDPTFAVHTERQQFHSSEIIAAVQPHINRDTWRLLAITERDLYIPILTFVFGEAQMGGPCGVVSAHRLRQEFYGLSPNSEILQERLRKEAVHEIGHTLDLTHCDDYQCAMAPSHAVEWIDLKDSGLCSSCRARVRVS